MADRMEQIVSLCKRRGFIFPSADIYGGLRGFWDYGPNGAKLKKNIRDLWWREMVASPPLHPTSRLPLEVLPIDGSIITNPRVWEASGHVERFKDRFYHCANCNSDFRDDEAVTVVTPPESPSRFERPGFLCVGRGCPNCRQPVLGEPRDFNLMFQTEAGPLETERVTAYLRPETAQSMFINYKNVLDTMRVKVPFGLAQIGKAFRNEVTPRNFTFRSREFEQMEIEFFIRPDEAEAWFPFWVSVRRRWWVSLGINPERLHLNVHSPSDLAHYAKGGQGVTDIEYDFPFGRAELEGIAHRTDFDLRQHAEKSGERLDYWDEERKERYVPHVIEPSAGLDRAVLAVLCEAYAEDANRPSGMYMKFDPKIAPIKFAIFPLVNRDGMPEIAQNLFLHYRHKYDCVVEHKQHIGKRYARMDEVGTPFCITVDSDTLSDNTITVRFRDDAHQERMKLRKLESFLNYHFGA